MIYRIPAGGGEAVPMTSSRGREPIAAADGKSLYYTSGDRLWRKDLEGGGLYLNNHRVTDVGRLITLGDLLFGRHMLLRKGRKNYVVMTVPV